MGGHRQLYPKAILCKVTGMPLTVGLGAGSINPAPCDEVFDCTGKLSYLEPLEV